MRHKKSIAAAAMLLCSTFAVYNVGSTYAGFTVSANADAQTLKAGPVNLKFKETAGWLNGATAFDAQAGTMTPGMTLTSASTFTVSMEANLKRKVHFKVIPVDWDKPTADVLLQKLTLTAAYRVNGVPIVGTGLTQVQNGTLVDVTLTLNWPQDDSGASLIASAIGLDRIAVSVYGGAQ